MASIPKLPFSLPEINFERLISRGLARYLSSELDLAGIQLSVNKLLEFMIIPFFIIFIVGSALIYTLLGLAPLLSGAAGLGAGVVCVGFIFVYIEYLIDQKKTKVETMLPDYFQIVAANLRSGISLERAMLLAARPEFTFLSDRCKGDEQEGFRGRDARGVAAGFRRQVQVV